MTGTDKKSPADGCMPTHAMVLAAGMGERMKPITETIPKPMIPVNGRPLIDRAIDRLEEAGIRNVTVNLHHLGQLIEDHLKERSGPAILFSPEGERLDTGGGVKNALALLRDGPFFVANGDIMWLNGSENALHRMCAFWDDKKMDGLLLVHSTVDAYGYEGRGDFCVDPDGLLSRRPESEVSPYLFTGVQLLHPRLFKGTPDGAFSLNLLYDRAMAEGRLYGLVHDGEWFHVGTPEGLAEAEAYMEVRYAGNKRR